MRRYIDAKDLEYEWQHMRESLYYHMDKLLKNIIVPEFKTFSNDYYLDEITDVRNNVKFICRFSVENDKIMPNKENDYTSADFLKKFLAIYPEIVKNITKKMSPVNTKELNKAELSEDQFIIKLIDLTIYPEVRVFNEANEPGYYIKEIYIELILNIEDVSELHPDGIQMLYLKYKNLCKDNSIYSLTELKQWIGSLGYKVDTKQQMCQLIKMHYDF